MDEIMLWEIVQKNAGHIAVMNKELGGLLMATGLHTRLIVGQFVALALIFTANLINIKMTKKNGNGRKN